MRIIALTNQKGGTGKTTSALNIGTGLASLQKKVLLVDLDPQANLTYSLGVEADKIDKTIYELLTGKATASEVMVTKYGVDLIPSNIELSGAEIELSGVAGRELLLKEALSNLRGYDYLLIDCPPSLGLLTLNGLTTAKEIFIPLQAEYLSLQGMSKLLQTVDIVKKRLNPRLEITGIIATLYDHRRRLNREVVEKIQGYFGDKLFKTVIRDNVALAEAPSYGQDIFSYNKRSHGSQDYLKLCKEIVKKEEARHER